MKVKKLININKICLIMIIFCMVFSGCSKKSDESGVSEEVNSDAGSSESSAKEQTENEKKEDSSGKNDSEEKEPKKVKIIPDKTEEEKKAEEAEEQRQKYLSLTDTDGMDDYYLPENCLDGYSYMHSQLRNELSGYEIVSNIIPDSVKYESDGTVYFSATGPDGSEMRFWGYDIEPSPEGIKFNTKGRLVSLDSYGRIYSLDPYISENSDESNWSTTFAVFDTTLNMHPGTLDNMRYQSGGSICSGDYATYSFRGDFVYLQPYFFGFGTATPDYEPEAYENPGYYIVSKLHILYRDEKEMQPLRRLLLNPMNYGCYIEGEKYDPEKEGRFDYKKQIFDFDLIAIPDLYEDYLELPLDRFYVWDPMLYGYEISYGSWSVGELRDSTGKVLEKNNARIEKGMTLDVTVGGIKYDVELPVIDTVKDGKNIHELQRHKSPDAIGDLNVLCIPFSWSDERNRATDEQLEKFCVELGRVSDMNGNVKDYSDSANRKRFSLSDYMNMASYGKLNITTYMTDWYPCESPFSEMQYNAGNYLYNNIYDWLLETYPDQDWNMFDKDNDHYYDAVIFLNAGDMSGASEFIIASFGGAFCNSQTYGIEDEYIKDYYYAHEFNTAVYCHSDQLANNTLIHEFSHLLGLIDYYDVSYSGIDAVGDYDMQDSNTGDWNAFSKYAVGWINPIRVTDLAPGESMEYEISPMSSSGDAIVIPAAGDKSDTPFGEYMMVDLFANVGTHVYDAPDYGLSKVVGVRIYHVDAVMEARNYIESPREKVSFPIGTFHYGNNYKESGRYQIELIQAGGINTFTKIGSGRNQINASDFFNAGSTFTTAKYSQFFDGGVFDYGADFGYSIDVVSITGTGKDAKAVIRITRQ